MPACPPSDEAPCWLSLSASVYRQRYPYAPSFLPTSWTWLRRGLVPRAPAPGDRCGTGRTSGNSPWIDRTAYNDCSSGWSTSPDGAPWRSRIFLPCDRYSPLLVLTKRHAHLFAKSPTFLVGLCCGRNSHIQSTDLADLVIVDLRKDNLFPYPDVVIAPPIKGVRDIPRKSRIRGRAMLVRRSSNSYM